MVQILFAMFSVNNSRPFSQSAYFVDHGSTPRPIDAVVEGCAVHLAVDTFAFGHHWNCLRAVDVYITPPASHALAHGAFGTLESLPIPMIAVRHDFKDFTKGEIPSSRDIGCAAMGMSVIFVSRDGCVTSFCES